MGTRQIKLVSWNVNGLRAIMKKGFLETFADLNADILAIQETKLQAHQRTQEMTSIDGYQSYWSDSIVKKGYSGVGIYSRLPPQSVKTGIGLDRYDHEGRILELDIGDFIFFNVYFPNGQMSQERLDYKQDFYADFFAYTDKLKADGRSIIICGDFNIAHHPIDLKNPKANEKRSGFLRIERDWLDRIVDHGYVDTFRHFYPETIKYSWWTYRFKARERNAGWRIDYFFVSRDIIDKGWVTKPFINTDIYGSDHCPVGLILNI